MNPNWLDEWKRNLLSRRGIAALAGVGIVVWLIIQGWGPPKEVAEDIGWRTAPRAPASLVPLGFVDPTRLVAATESIEVARSDAPVLFDEGRTRLVVAFDYQGMTPTRELAEDGAVTLVAHFGVKVDDGNGLRNVGKQLVGGSVQVKSIYDRTLVTDLTASPLQLVEGDVVTVLGRQFTVERVWHPDELGRGLGNTSLSVLLVEVL